MARALYLCVREDASLVNTGVPSSDNLLYAPPFTDPWPQDWNPKAHLAAFLSPTIHCGADGD